MATDNHCLVVTLDYEESVDMEVIIIALGMTGDQSNSMFDTCSAKSSGVW